MTTELIHTAWLAGAFLVLFASGEFFLHVRKVTVELTRKWIHLGTGLLSLLFPVFLKNHWMVLVLCGSFLLILWASLKFGWLKSINAINRKSEGALLYPVVVYTTYLVYTHYGSPLFFYLPILLLAICDPIAALLGKKWPYGKYKAGTQYKTLMGSAGFFLSATVVCGWHFYVMSSLPPIQILLFSAGIAFVVTLAEAFSRNGFDNLLIPYAALACLAGMDQWMIMV